MTSQITDSFSISQNVQQICELHAWGWVRVCRVDCLCDAIILQNQNNPFNFKSFHIFSSQLWICKVWSERWMVQIRLGECVCVCVVCLSMYGCGAVCVQVNECLPENWDSISFSGNNDEKVPFKFSLIHKTPELKNFSVRLTYTNKTL